MPKPKLELPVSDTPVGNYFAGNTKKGLEFVHTGSTLLDTSIGGGWPLGKVSNIVGDSSSGKSLLAIEHMTNFALTYPQGDIFYLEAEAGFDKEYARNLGLPLAAITFVDDELLLDFTIESWYEHISEVLKNSQKGSVESQKPILYIVDSLDAMSDRAEVGREITEGSYSMNKQKKLGELFRRITKDVEKSRLHLQIISQIRENIGVSFGNKYRRSGGKALDFYASQIVWLTKAKQIKQTIRKVERVVGVDVTTNCSKNKVGLPFRKSAFKIIFGYGIDDIASMLDWLKEVDALKDFACPITNAEIKQITTYSRKYKALSKPDRDKIQLALSQHMVKVWETIETEFLPIRNKYE